MRTVTAAILIQDSKVLIGQRKIGKQMGGLWEFPGGKLEEGETPQECLAREMQEEFGIEVNVGEFFEESVYHYETGTIRLLAYRVQWQSGDMNPTDHQDFRWVSFEDLSTYAFVPADKPFVAKLQQSSQAS